VEHGKEQPLGIAGKYNLVMPAEEDQDRTKKFYENAEIDNPSQQGTGIGKLSRAEEVFQNGLVFNAVGSIESGKEGGKRYNVDSAQLYENHDDDLTFYCKMSCRIHGGKPGHAAGTGGSE
jgi:hypothetical protein